MLNLTEKCECVVEKLNESFKKEEGIAIHYGLYMMKLSRSKKYFILAECDAESELCVVGENKDKAIELYALVRENMVTPCTLKDVCEDFNCVWG